MANRTELTGRRRILKAGACSLLALAAAPFVSKPARAAERVAESDPTALALGYREDATQAHHPQYVAGRNCGACRFYTATADADWGSCSVFQNRLVATKGWCSAWAARS
jgi:hypothetical protein